MPNDPIFKEQTEIYKKEVALMTDKLKPCPFCGEEAHLDRHDIFCDCGVTMVIPTFVHEKESVGGFPTYEEAKQEMIENWNRRADNDR